MTEKPFESVRLSEIEGPGGWKPVRRHFGIQAFGVNAWVGREAGETVISEHHESPSGHEELYLVIDGAATFTVADETIDAPAGTLVFVRDPSVQRAATAKTAGTTILSIGAKPGEAFEPRPWEENAGVISLFEMGDFAEAKRRLEPLVAKHPDAGGLLYNLACAESRLGEREPAIAHLRRAIEIEPGFADHAKDDPDFEPIRDDAEFVSAIAGESKTDGAGP